MRPLARAALGFGALALLSSCAPEADAQVSRSDRARFAQQHTQILEAMGGRYEGPGAAMVTRIGRVMAVRAGLSRTGSDCTVTLLNSTMVNAFAVPGCYVYVTRGLLAAANDEAELASVLGHELGHVAAEHAQKRQNRSIFAGLGAAAAAVLTGSSQVGQAAGQIAQLGVLSYSRGQEYEADRLGVRYMVAAGYDPRAAASMLSNLIAEERLQARLRGRFEADQLPNWLRTHPATEDRVRRASELAAKTPSATGVRNRAPYLAAINGMTFGDDPAQGFVDGRRFAHPELRIAFTAPPGFYLQNSPAAVTMIGPKGEQAKFGGGTLQPGEPLGSFAQRVATQFVGNRAMPITVQSATVNGIPAAFVPIRANAQGRQVSLGVAAYQGDGPMAFYIVGLGVAGVADRSLEELFQSFRRLTPQEARALRPRVLEARTVAAGDTVESLSQQMPFSELKVERFIALNNISRQTALRPGEQVKLVRFAR